MSCCMAASPPGVSQQQQCLQWEAALTDLFLLSLVAEASRDRHRRFGAELLECH